MSGELLVINCEVCVLFGDVVDDVMCLFDLFEGLGWLIIEWISDVVEGKMLNICEFLCGIGVKQDFFVQVVLYNVGFDEDWYLIVVLNDMIEFKLFEVQFV